MTAKFTILITGANRGLGLEFCQQYLAAGWKVIATCRQPKQANELQQLQRQYQANLQIERLDVTNQQQITQLRQGLNNEKVDILLLNAGIFGSSGVYFGDLEPEPWLEVVRVNMVAPVMVAQALYNPIVNSDKKLIVAIGSSMGVVSKNRRGWALLLSL